MHRIVPELIIENFRAGRERGSFPAVGMFLDLSGFSSTTDALMQHGQNGAEALAGLMHNIFDPIIQCVFEHRGQIVGFAGDGVMALFPVNADADSVALHALLAAWTIQKNFSSHSTQQTAYGTFSITARIGLTCGNVSWGILRSRDNKRATYYFRGPAVDESAHAEHFASPGGISLTESMYQIVRDHALVNSEDIFHHVNEVRAELPAVALVDFPPVDLDASRFFVPEEVVAQDLRGEFRQVVNLFMRFPDLPDDQLQSFMYKIFDLQEKYGGLLNRLDFGDKGCNILMLWGAPVAYENSIGRALNFILDLQSNTEFPVTAGVTFYIAHAGYLGSTMCEDYTCYGWGVNLAARFMMTAPVGQIWIDDRIARRVVNRFDLELIGAQRFKGFASLQKVYALNGRKPDSGITYQGETVGREADLKRLKKFIEPLWHGKYAGMLVIRGDAGIGKGRLVYEFKSSDVFDVHRATWAVCRSDQILRNSFNPFRHWLLSYFGLSRDKVNGTPEKIFDAKLDQLISAISDHELSSELNRLRSVLGALVDLYWPDSFYEQLDAEGRYNNTLLALMSLLKAESIRRPLILFIDDIHYLDPESQLFVSRLRQNLTAQNAYPIAIIATARNHGGSFVVGKEFADLMIDLDGLSSDGVAYFAEIILDHKISSDLANLLMRLSGGNPFFVEQILHYMEEENLLEMSQSGWTIAGWSDESALPADVHTLVVARLDLLGREVSEVVQTASALGREFDVDLLLEMLGDKEANKQMVLGAEKAGIWSVRGSSRCMFLHGLMRDVAYNMQLSSRKRYLHKLALGTIENLYQSDLQNHYGELAYHAENAGLMDVASHYLVLAGKSSAAAYQNAQAVDYFSRALVFLPRDDLAGRFDLKFERAGLYGRLGDRKSQSQDLEALDELALQLNNANRNGLISMAHAEFSYAVGDFHSAIDWAERTLAISQPLGDIKTTLDAYVVWLQAILRFGKAGEAMIKADVALKLAQGSRLRFEEGKILNIMGLIALEQGLSDVAGNHLQRALAISHEIKERSLELRVVNNLANLTGVVKGDYSAARMYYQSALAMSRDQGDRYREGMALANLGWVEEMLGDVDAAQLHLQRASTIAREVGNRYNEAYALINLSAVAGIRGDAPASFDYAQQAGELTRAIGERSGDAWSQFYIGYALLSLGNYADAQKAFENSVEIRNELNQPTLIFESSAGLIGIALARKELSAALREVEKIISFLNSGGTLEGAEEPLRIYLYCYKTLKIVKDPRATAMLADAIKLLQTRASKLSDDQARRTYIQNVPWRRAIEEAWMAENPN